MVHHRRRARFSSSGVICISFVIEVLKYIYVYPGRRYAELRDCREHKGSRGGQLQLESSSCRLQHSHLKAIGWSISLCDRCAPHVCQLQDMMSRAKVYIHILRLKCAAHRSQRPMDIGTFKATLVPTGLLSAHVQLEVDCPPSMC